MRSLQTSSVEKDLPGFPTKFRWFFSLSVSFFLFLGFVFWNPILMAQEPADARDFYCQSEANKWVEQIFVPINSAVGKELSPEELENAKRGLASETAAHYKRLLDPQTLPSLKEWFKNEKNRDITRTAGKGNNQVEVGRFLQRGGLEKYSPEKFEKIRRLRKALHKGDLDGPFAFLLVAAHLRSLDASRKGQFPPPPEVPDRSFFPLTEAESRSYEQAVQNHERNGLVTLAYAYEDAADGDLEKYLDFLEQGAGKNWMEASFQSNLQGIKAGAEIMWKLAWKVAARSR